MVMREAQDLDNAARSASKSKSTERPSVPLREQPSADIGGAPRVLVKKALPRSTPTLTLPQNIGGGLRAWRSVGKVRSVAMIAAAFALAGCAAGAGPAPTVRPLMVQVPVLHETPCPVPALADPALPLAGVGPESPPADTMRAYAAAVAILKGAVRERDAVLAGCARADRPARAQAENVQ
jgi:hypothetical protein